MGNAPLFTWMIAALWAPTRDPLWVSGQPPLRWPRPDRFEGAAIAIVIAINVFFWWPYVQYFITIPPEVFQRRQTIASISPELVRKIALQMVPTDLFYFFDPHRFEFLEGDWRRWSYTGAVYAGAPLVIYGTLCWLRRPWSLPVLGVWWLIVLAVFALTRILTQPYYALILAPITALLPAGAFDSPAQPRWLKVAFGATRIAYVMALLVLSASTLSWLSSRGGAAGEYGIAYRTRVLQARTLVSGVGRVTTVLCEDWILERDRLTYRWQFAVKAK